MPAASSRTTTSPAKPRASQADAPTIIALGRIRAFLGKAMARHDEAQYQGPETEEGQRAKIASNTAENLLLSQALGLDAAIRAMRPATLADVAVQLSRIADNLSVLTGFKTTEGKMLDALEEIERLTLAALPIVAQAAGLDVDEMDWDGQVKLGEHKFGALEAAR